MIASFINYMYEGETLIASFISANPQILEVLAFFLGDAAMHDT